MLLSAALLAAAVTGWVYERRVDQFNDTVTHEATVESKSKQMSILFSCSGKGDPTYTFVATRSFDGRYLPDGLRDMPFDVRSGARPAVSISILGLRNVAPAYKGAGSNYDILDREMTSGEPTMIVRAQMISAGLVTESFDMRNAKASIEKAKAGCGLM